MLRLSRLVLQKLQSIWDSCPDNVKYSPAVWDQSLSSFDIWFLLGSNLDYLYSKFLIFRCNARQDQSQETLQLLCLAARDVLSAVLTFNEHREQMREVRSDFSAVVSAVLRVSLRYPPVEVVDLTADALVPAVWATLCRRPRRRAAVSPFVLFPHPRLCSGRSTAAGPVRNHPRADRFRLVPQLDARPTRLQF
jgi:hypothetical protein